MPSRGQLEADGPVVPVPSAVGVFDSGLGGLSVVRHLQAQDSARPVIYVADQVNAPYGSRPAAGLRDLSAGIVRFLRQHGSGVIVIACHSASSAALHWLRETDAETVFVGMEPAVKPAVFQTRTGRIGLIATSATLDGPLYAGLLARFGQGVEVVAESCPAFVELVEMGCTAGVEARDAVRRGLERLVRAGVDTLVLGCTHYAFLRELIAAEMGPDVAIIDPGFAVARQALRMLARHVPASPEAPSGEVAHRFYTTGDPVRFARTLRVLFGVSWPVLTARWVSNE